MKKWLHIIFGLLVCVLIACGCSDKKDVDCYFMQGEQLAGEHNYPPAVEAFKRALEIYPDSKRTHYELGYLYFRMQEPSQAIPHFKRVTELDNGSFLSYHFLADCLLSIGKFKEAERTRQKALKLAHFHTSITQSSLAFIYGVQGDYNKAIEEKLKSMEYSSNTVGYYQLANLYFKIKDYQQVIDSLDSVKGLEKFHTDIHYMRSISFLNLKKKDQAMEEYEKLKLVNPLLAVKLRLEITLHN